jgi:hypothetical protein
MTTITVPDEQNINIRQSNNNNAQWEYEIGNGGYTAIANYPVTINHGNSGYILSLKSNLNIKTLDHYILINKSNSNLIVINGENNSITTNDNNESYVKPFFDFSSSTNNSNITVVNIKYNGNKPLENGNGFLFAKNFASNGNVISIENIINNSAVQGLSGATGLGGIFSSDCFLQSTSVEILNCGNHGEINCDYSGGIFGQNCFNNGFLLSTSKCFNTGNIVSNYTGGIFAANSLQGITAYTKSVQVAQGYNQNIFAYGCFNIGDISGNTSGGIFGPNCLLISKQIQFPYNLLV